MAILGCAVSAGASTITTDCSNAHATIKKTAGGGGEDRNAVIVLVSRYDSSGKFVDQIEKFYDLNITESERVVMSQTGGMSSSEVYTVKMTFSRKDGLAMPDAYSKLKNPDGSLSDNFICEIVRTSTPRFP